VTQFVGLPGIYVVPVTIRICVYQLRPGDITESGETVIVLHHRYDGQKRRVALQKGDASRFATWWSADHINVTRGSVDVR
jgi:hypothetical protein